MRGHFVVFECPECSYTHFVKWLPATRWDPACLAGDPPDECSRCDADMTDVESRGENMYDGPDDCDGPEYEPPDRMEGDDGW